MAYELHLPVAIEELGNLGVVSVRRTLKPLFVACRLKKTIMRVRLLQLQRTLEHDMTSGDASRCVVAHSGLPVTVRGHFSCCSWFWF